MPRRLVIIGGDAAAMRAAGIDLRLGTAITRFAAVLPRMGSGPAGGGKGGG